MPVHLWANHTNSDRVKIIGITGLKPNPI